MSMAMALQFLIFMLLLQKVILRVPLFYKIDVSILPSDKLNYFLDFFILFLMPILLLNYFLIFFNNRYERLIEKYEYHHGKYAIIYMLGTFVGIGLLMLIGFLVKIILG
jgi:hypothetical protein